MFHSTMSDNSGFLWSLATTKQLVTLVCGSYAIGFLIVTKGTYTVWVE